MRGPDNTVATTDKAKKPFSKSKKFDDIKYMHCIWHLHGNHPTGECHIFLDKYTRKRETIKKSTRKRKKSKTSRTKGSRSIKAQ
jgi:hypothetical protein